jgi:hypothetical protein
MPEQTTVQVPADQGTAPQGQQQQQQQQTQAQTAQQSGTQQQPTQTQTRAQPTFDISKYEQEFTANGKLSDATYAELLNTHRVSKEAVDEFISLRQSKQQANADAVLATVGGQENFQRLSQWASQNLSDAELAAYNAQVNGGVDAAKLALAGLKARYDAAFGNPPSLVNRTSAAPSGPAPFNSVAEVKAAMRDARYRTDTAYQAEVAARMAASKVF